MRITIPVVLAGRVIDLPTHGEPSKLQDHLNAEAEKIRRQAGNTNKTRIVRRQEFIIGMVKGNIMEMFQTPTQYFNRTAAEAAACNLAERHTKAFPIYKLVASFGPTLPLIEKVTYK